MRETIHTICNLTPIFFSNNTNGSIRFITSSRVVEGHPVGPVVAHVPAVLLVPAALRKLGAHRVLLLLLPLPEVGLHPQLLIEVVLALLLVQRLQRWTIFSVIGNAKHTDLLTEIPI